MTQEPTTWTVQAMIDALEDVTEYKDLSKVLRKIKREGGDVKRVLNRIVLPKLERRYPCGVGVSKYYRLRQKLIESERPAIVDRLSGGGKSKSRSKKGPVNYKANNAAKPFRAF